MILYSENRRVRGNFDDCQVVIDVSPDEENCKEIQYMRCLCLYNCKLLSIDLLSLGLEENIPCPVYNPAM